MVYSRAVELLDSVSVDVCYVDIHCSVCSGSYTLGIYSTMWIPHIYMYQRVSRLSI